jgi:hypothetical protein
MDEHYINPKENKGLCLTFHEAFIILADLIEYKDFTLFLQEHGLADDDGVPCTSELGGNAIIAVDAPEEEKEFSTNGKHYFITKPGMKEIFNIALSKYLLERHPQLEY